MESPSFYAYVALNLELDSTSTPFTELKKQGLELRPIIPIFEGSLLNEHLKGFKAVLLEATGVLMNTRSPISTNPVIEDMSIYRRSGKIVNNRFIPKECWMRSSKTRLGLRILNPYFDILTTLQEKLIETYIGGYVSIPQKWFPFMPVSNLNKQNGIPRVPVSEGRFIPTEVFLNIERTRGIPNKTFYRFTESLFK